MTQKSKYDDQVFRAKIKEYISLINSDGLFTEPGGSNIHTQFNKKDSVMVQNFMKYGSGQA